MTTLTNKFHQLILSGRRRLSAAANYYLATIMTIVVVVCFVVPQTWSERLVAAGTLALAAATIALILDARSGRRGQQIESEAASFRAALIEQLENCRYWKSNSPQVSPTALLQLVDWTPCFDELMTLLGTVSIPGDVVAYLIWLTAHYKIHHQQNLQKPLNIVKTLGISKVQSQMDEISQHWRDQLGFLQEIECLLVAEANRRGLTDVAEAFCPDADWLPWLKPMPGPQQERGAIEQDRKNYKGAPPWPTDPAYAQCSPWVRVQQANEQRHDTLAAITNELSVFD